MNKICCFCEIELENNAIFCPNCLEYKGIMTIEDFENTYGEKVL